MQRILPTLLIVLWFVPGLAFAQQTAMDKALSTPANKVEVGVIKANMFLDHHLSEFVGTEWDEFDVMLHRYRALFAMKTKKVVLALRFLATSREAFSKESCAGILGKFKNFVTSPKSLVDLNHTMLGELFGYELTSDPAMRDQLANDVQMVAHITSRDDAEYITCLVPLGEGDIVYSE